jgi:hypothetical protein
VVLNGERLTWSSPREQRHQTTTWMTDGTLSPARVERPSFSGVGKYPHRQSRGWDRTSSLVLRKWHPYDEPRINSQQLLYFQQRYGHLPSKKKISVRHSRHKINYAQSFDELFHSKPIIYRLPNPDVRSSGLDRSLGHQARR